VLFRSLAKNGAIINLGWHNDIQPRILMETMIQLLESTDQRSSMIHAGQRLVDGEGVSRIVMYLKNDKFRFRNVSVDDMRQVWKWANDPDIREVSFSSELIPWDRHEEWFHSKINDPNCLFYLVISENETPMGQVRFDVEGDVATISIGLDKKFRGQGFGYKIIASASRMLFSQKSVRCINAFIKISNTASIKAFEKAGYIKTEQLAIHGQTAVHFTKFDEKMN
jgi:UDP-2,4-diacetamido-2,4,6-trideoxy-beta-L-altropyranose hydrolase